MKNKNKNRCDAFSGLDLSIYVIKKPSPARETVQANFCKRTPTSFARISGREINLSGERYTMAHISCFWKNIAF
jgi:hypothetical protein